MRLVRAEFLRYRSRPAMWVITALMILFPLAMASLTAYNSRPLSPNEDSQVAAQLEKERQIYSDDLEQCLRNPAEFIGPSATEADCQAQQPVREDFLPRTPLALDKQLPYSTQMVSVLVGLALLAGTTYAGADHRSGALRTLITATRKRGEVWLARALVVSVSSMVVGVATLVGYWLILGWVSEARGLTQPDWVDEVIVNRSLRAVLLMGAAAVGGYALTTLTRRTWLTISGLLIYIIVGESVTNVLPGSTGARWSISNNVQAWVDYGTVLLDPCNGKSPCPGLVTLAFADALAYLGLIALVISLMSWLVFSRRDL